MKTSQSARGNHALIRGRTGPRPSTARHVLNDARARRRPRAYHLILLSDALLTTTAEPQLPGQQAPRAYALHRWVELADAATQARPLPAPVTLASVRAI